QIQFYVILTHEIYIYFLI
ncbi:hypothetical protein RDABS01_001814, partial [Bienertia sinuspersici]